jgi:hypothetical protein
MSFDVHLIASTLSPPPGAFEAKVDAALQALGVEGQVIDQMFRTHDGSEAEIYAEGGGGAMFTLRGFSSSVAEVVFTVADVTSCFITWSDADALLLRTPSNLGATPDDDLPVPLLVDDAAALMTLLTGGFDGWSQLRDQVVAAPPPRKKSWLGQLFSRS